jgi:hypothetical protein
MLQSGVQAFSNDFVNVLVLALWPTLPVLVFGYIRQSLVVARIPPDFSLRKSESIELNRALRLYRKVSRRLDELRDRKGHAIGWRALFNKQSEAPRQKEFEDLEAYAEYLQATIIRLKCRPLQRLRSWVHGRSLQFAFGRALAVYIAGIVAALMIAFHLFEQSAWADEFMSGVSNVIVWYPIDERLFYANAVGTAITVLAAPVFYLMRRVSLRREYGLEFCVFNDLARIPQGQEMGSSQDEDATQDQPRQVGAGETFRDHHWSAVLGLSESPSIEELRKTYKVLIKQNHPDRVHGMSPAFARLADSETKKITAAYREALVYVRSLQTGQGRQAGLGDDRAFT